MIPRILHHIWIGPGRPSERELACRQSALDLHPRWTALLHTDASLLERDDLPLGDVLPRLYPTARKWAIKADLLKVAALWVYGGVALDMDMWCLRPLDDLLELPMILTRIGKHRTVSEAIMGFPPRAPELERIVDNIAWLVKRCGIGDMSIRLRMAAEKHGWPLLPSTWFVPYDCHEIGPVPPDAYCFHAWKNVDYPGVQFRL